MWSVIEQTALAEAETEYKKKIKSYLCQISNNKHQHQLLYGPQPLGQFLVIKQ